MTPRRNLDVGKTKRFALKIDTTIKVIDGSAFANQQFVQSFDSIHSAANFPYLTSVDERVK